MVPNLFYSKKTRSVKVMEITLISLSIEFRSRIEQILGKVTRRGLEQMRP